GKFHPSGNEIDQELPGAVGGGEYGAPAAFDGQVYFGGVGATLRAFRFVNGRLQATPASQSSHTFGYPGTTPSVSSDGNANGIVWAIDDSQSTAVLYAYEASDLSRMLYNSDQAPGGRDSVGPSNKFITPTIADGRVYVATADGVAVFGLLTTAPAPVRPQVQVDLSSAFNRTGIVADGTRFGGGGIDRRGHALSADQLGASLTAGGVTFDFGPAGVADVVGAARQTIALPAGNDASLKLLAIGVNGNRVHRTFIVTYADGTKARFTRSIGGWAARRGGAGASTALTTGYRDTSRGLEQPGRFRVYELTFTLDPTREVRSLTLPRDANVVVLAATLLPAGVAQVEPAPGRPDRRLPHLLHQPAPARAIHSASGLRSPVQSRHSRMWVQSGTPGHGRNPRDS
ncbi:MAG TPA: hypothetical protein VKW77_02575, partial [Acidimicrobiales bacterium]|nr:hypothetical protein [Acidimicrobiales bacterium]